MNRALSLPVYRVALDPEQFSEVQFELWNQAGKNVDPFTEPFWINLIRVGDLRRATRGVTTIRNIGNLAFNVKRTVPEVFNSGASFRPTGLDIVPNLRTGSRPIVAVIFEDPEAVAQQQKLRGAVDEALESRLNWEEDRLTLNLGAIKHPERIDLKQLGMLLPREIDFGVGIQDEPQKMFIG